MPSHRIVGSEVGRPSTPGNGSIRLMGRTRRRRTGLWALLLAPLALIGGLITAIVLWPFR